MNHVLTVKIPHSLLNELNEVSEKKGLSKGALVRAAVKHFLRQESTEESTTETIQNITKALFQKKSIKTKVNWDELRRKARSDTGLSPEEEVMQYRRRRL